MTGPGARRAVKLDPHRSEPPVVLMSANIDQPELRDVLRHEGALRFLRQPIAVDRLVEAVVQAVGGPTSGTRSPRRVAPVLA
jgi:CheY-like chemotaxis protein